MSVFDNVAARLKEHLPVRKSDGKPITAWAEQAKALNKIASDVAALKREVFGEDPPPPPPPPPTSKLAPLTYNASDRADARYCVAGLQRGADGVLTDGVDRYDDDGRSLGGRRRTFVEGLRFSDNMNDLGPCDPYPPFLGGWPAESYQP